MGKKTKNKPIFAWVTQGKTEHLVTIVDTNVIALLNNNDDNDDGGGTTKKVKVKDLSSLSQDSKILIKWQTTGTKQTVVVSSVKLMNLLDDGNTDNDTGRGGRRGGSGDGSKSSSLQARASRRRNRAGSSMLLPPPPPPPPPKYLPQQHQFSSSQLHPSSSSDELEVSSKQKKKLKPKIQMMEKRDQGDVGVASSCNRSSSLSSTFLSIPKTKNRRIETVESDDEDEMELVDFDVYEVKKKTASAEPHNNNNNTVDYRLNDQNHESKSIPTSTSTRKTQLMMSDSKKKKKKKRKKEITLNDDDKDDNDDANKFNLTAAGSVVTTGVVSATETITKSSFGSVGPKNIIRMKKKEEKNRIQFSPPLIIEDDNISQKKMKNAVVPNNSNCDSNSNGTVHRKAVAAAASSEKGIPTTAHLTNDNNNNNNDNIRKKKKRLSSLSSIISTLKTTTICTNIDHNTNSNEKMMIKKQKMKKENVISNSTNNFQYHLDHQNSDNVTSTTVVTTAGDGINKNHHHQQQKQLEKNILYSAALLEPITTTAAGGRHQNCTNNNTDNLLSILQQKTTNSSISSAELSLSRKEGATQVKACLAETSDTDFDALKTVSTVSNSEQCRGQDNGSDNHNTTSTNGPVDSLVRLSLPVKYNDQPLKIRHKRKKVIRHYTSPSSPSSLENLATNTQRKNHPCRTTFSSSNMRRNSSSAESPDQQRHVTLSLKKESEDNSSVAPTITRAIVEQQKRRNNTGTATADSDTANFVVCKAKKLSQTKKIATPTKVKNTTTSKQRLLKKMNGKSIRAPTRQLVDFTATKKTTMQTTKAGMNMSGSGKSTSLGVSEIAASIQAPKSSTVTVLQRPWTVEDDRKLNQLVERYGTHKKWKKIAKHFQGRKGRHCRERWNEIEIDNITFAAAGATTNNSLNGNRSIEKNDDIIQRQQQRQIVGSETQSSKISSSLLTTVDIKPIDNLTKKNSENTVPKDSLLPSTLSSESAVTKSSKKSSASSEDVAVAVAVNNRSIIDIDSSDDEAIIYQTGLKLKEEDKKKEAANSCNATIKEEMLANILANGVKQRCKPPLLPPAIKSVVSPPKPRPHDGDMSRSSDKDGICSKEETLASSIKQRCDLPPPITTTPKLVIPPPTPPFRLRVPPPPPPPTTTPPPRPPQISDMYAGSTGWFQAPSRPPATLPSQGNSSDMSMSSEEEQTRSKEESEEDSEEEGEIGIEEETLSDCIQQRSFEDRKWLVYVFGSSKPEKHHLNDILHVNNLSKTGTLTELLQSLIFLRNNQRKIDLKTFRDLVDIEWTRGPLDREWVRNLCGSPHYRSLPHIIHLQDVLRANNLSTIGNTGKLVQNLINARDNSKRKFPLKSFRDITDASWARELQEKSNISSKTSTMPVKAISEETDACANNFECTPRNKSIENLKQHKDDDTRNLVQKKSNDKVTAGTATDHTFATKTTAPVALLATALEDVDNKKIISKNVPQHETMQGNQQKIADIMTASSDNSALMVTTTAAPVTMAASAVEVADEEKFSPKTTAFPTKNSCGILPCSTMTKDNGVKIGLNNLSQTELKQKRDGRNQVIAYQDIEAINNSTKGTISKIQRKSTNGNVIQNNDGENKRKIKSSIVEQKSEVRIPKKKRFQEGKGNDLEKNNRSAKNDPNDVKNQYNRAKSEAVRKKSTKAFETKAPISDKKRPKVLILDKERPKTQIPDKKRPIEAESNRAKVKLHRKNNSTRTKKIVPLKKRRYVINESEDDFDSRDASIYNDDTHNKKKMFSTALDQYTPKESNKEACQRKLVNGKNIPIILDTNSELTDKVFSCGISNDEESNGISYSKRTSEEATTTVSDTFISDTLQNNKLSTERMENLSKGVKRRTFDQSIIDDTRMPKKKRRVVYEQTEEWIDGPKQKRHRGIAVSAAHVKLDAVGPSLRNKKLLTTAEQMKIISHLIDVKTKAMEPKNSEGSSNGGVVQRSPTRPVQGNMIAQKVSSNASHARPKMKKQKANTTNWTKMKSMLAVPRTEKIMPINNL